MSSPSIYEMARNISNTAGQGRREGRDLGNIEAILAEAKQANNPEYINNAMAKILSSVSPERQQNALAQLTNMRSGLETKQQRERTEQAGKQFNLPPGFQDLPTEARKGYFDMLKPPKEGAITSRPVPPEVSQVIRQIMNENKDATAEELTIALDEAGIPRAYSNAHIESRRREQELKDKSIDKSYDIQKDFIDKITSTYQAFETDMKPRLMQMQKLETDEQLIGPAAAQFLESFQIPLGVLENPSNELYDKLSQDLLKGLPETYGNRILKVEVENFLKTIPRLINSPNGRRMIASNFLKLGEIKEAFYKEMRSMQSDLIDKNAKFPKDFEQKVFDNVKPQLDRLTNEFVSLSEIKDVPENTVPFFNPQGGISFVPKNEKAIQWAQENGGKRIW
jgi:hypothetical protein